MTEILTMATIIAPVTLGVVEAIKQATGNHRFLPFIAIAVGILLGIAATFFVDAEITSRVWAGGISGLAATGLFEGLKNIKGDE